MTKSGNTGRPPRAEVTAQYCMLESMRPSARKSENLEERITKRIARKRGDVFMREDFRDLGSSVQIGRALRTLIRKGKLLRFGYGIYVRAELSPLDGKPAPAKTVRELATEALARLGAEVTESRAERAYNSGRSEQVPTGRVIAIRGKRIRRKLGYRGRFLILERARPDRPEPRPRKQRTPAPITVREALRLFWEVDRYPILGNEDLRASIRMEKEARARAATAKASPDDPAEFGRWLAALCSERLGSDEHDDIMEGLYALFDPTRGAAEAEAPNPIDIGRK